MKKLIVTYVILLGLFFTSSNLYAQAQTSSASIDPKTKAFLIICGYGTVGGGLLGLASMAFGQDSRAIAQGASLGLYGGILFGAYVIYTHNQDSLQPRPEDPSSVLPYEDNFVPYNGGIKTNSSSSIPHWYASSWNKLEDQNIFRTAPSVSWSWKF